MKRLTLEKVLSFYKNGKISKNTSWELQTWWAEDTYTLGLGTGFNTKCDHAGFFFEFQFIGFYFTFNINDDRHWDEENSKWVKYD